MIDPVEQPDEALALAAREDKAAFLALYDRYAPRLERYVLANVETRRDAEDVVSAAFLQALTGIGSFDPNRGSFAAWLFTLARNLVKMRYRRPTEVALDLAPDCPDSAPPPIDVALRKERAEAVHAAMRQLSPEHRDVIALRYLAELPFADIAQQLGTTEGAAKMRVRRALETLRRYLSCSETD